MKPRRWSGPWAMLQLALAPVALAAVAISAGALEAVALPAQEASESDTLTVDDVRRFLDPTVMINRFEYRFQANYLPDDVQIYSHRTRPWIALNSWSAAWVRIPWINVSLPDGSGNSGIGDLSVGWGMLVHENLGSRVTASAFGVDVVVPTGDRAKGTGFDRWILQPTAALVFNPTDLFPIYLIGRYHHSIADGDEPQNGRVRTLNFERADVPHPAQSLLSPLHSESLRGYPARPDRVHVRHRGGASHVAATRPTSLLRAVPIGIGDHQPGLPVGAELLLGPEPRPVMGLVDIAGATFPVRARVRSRIRPRSNSGLADRLQPFMLSPERLMLSPARREWECSNV